MNSDDPELMVDVTVTCINDEMDEEMAVSELVGTVDEDDDDELLGEDDAITKDVALLDEGPIVDGTTVSDSVLVEFEIFGKEEVIIVVLEAG